jgi:transposase
MTQDGAAAASPTAGEALREESGTATGPAVNWPVPQGVGPRAISQWSIMQRLSADEWKLMMNALPGRVGARARHGGNARRFIEAVLWVAQTGAYWSDLPRDFGSWHGIYVRFIRWSQDGNWNEVLARFEPKDQRAIDLHALVERYLHRNNTKHLSRAMRAS